MDVNVAKEVAALQRMTTKQLREKFAAVFGEVTAGNNRVWLVRWIAWRLQALAEGDLRACPQAVSPRQVRGEVPALRGGGGVIVTPA